MGSVSAPRGSLSSHPTPVESRVHPLVRSMGRCRFARRETAPHAPVPRQCASLTSGVQRSPAETAVDETAAANHDQGAARALLG